MLNTFTGNKRNIVVTSLLKEGKNELKLLTARVKDSVADNDIRLMLAGPARFSAEKNMHEFPIVVELTTAEDWTHDAKTGAPSIAPCPLKKKPSGLCPSSWMRSRKRQRSKRWPWRNRAFHRPGGRAPCSSTSTARWPTATRPSRQVSITSGQRGLEPLAVAEVRRHVGRGPEYLLRHTVPGTDPAIAVPMYRAHHPSVLLDGTTLLQGTSKS